MYLIVERKIKQLVNNEGPFAAQTETGDWVYCGRVFTFRLTNNSGNGCCVSVYVSMNNCMNKWKYSKVEAKQMNTHLVEIS